MKLLNTLLFFFLVCLISCTSEKKDDVQVQPDFSLVSPSKAVIENPKITSVIKGYIESNTGDPPRIYTLLMKREDILTTSFQLSSIITQSELNEVDPIGYFEVDGDIILVCTGLESLIKEDEAFTKQLRDIIGDRITNDLAPDGTKDPNYLPLMFDPSTWEVKVTRDSIAIEKGVANLLGPPIVEIIKFTPPKK